MYQTVVVSPIVIKSFEQLRPRDAVSFLNSLYTETFVVDRGGVIAKEYEEVFHSLPTLIKQKYIGFWGELFSHRAPKVNEIVDIAKRNFFEIEKLESEAKLARNNFCDFTLACTITDKQRLDFKFRFGCDGEISNIENYLNPNPISNVRATQEFELKAGDEFDFCRWIAKFIIDSFSLEIVDGYICSPLARRVLMFMLKRVKKNIQIKILTLNDKTRNGPIEKTTPKNDGIVIEKLLNELKIKYNLTNLNYELKNSKRELHSRWIKTDKFKIFLGHGLGFTKQNNNDGKDIVEFEATIIVTENK